MTTLEGTGNAFCQLDGMQLPEEQEVRPVPNEINLYKKKLYDLLSAKAEGLPISYKATQWASEDLQGAIIGEALSIFDDGLAAGMHNLEALGRVGEFIEHHTSSLTEAVLDVCGLQTEPSPSHVSVTELILNRYVETRMIEQVDDLDVSKIRVLISDAGFNGVLYAQREITRAVISATQETIAADSTPKTVEGNQPRTRGFRGVARLAFLGYRSR